MKILLNRDSGFLKYTLYLLEYKDNLYKLNSIPLFLKEGIQSYEDLNNCLFCYLYDDLTPSLQKKYENFILDIEIKEEMNIKKLNKPLKFNK